MKHVSQTDIAIHIRVILNCMPKGARNAGGWTGERAVNAAAAQIMDLFKRAVVLAPDDVPVPASPFTSLSCKPGQFGVTEPWPFEPGCRPPTTPQPPCAAAQSADDAPPSTGESP